jgi:hypothetical protein
VENKKVIAVGQTRGYSLRQLMRKLADFPGDFTVKIVADGGEIHIIDGILWNEDKQPHSVILLHNKE